MTIVLTIILAACFWIVAASFWARNVGPDHEWKEVAFIVASLVLATTLAHQIVTYWSAVLGG